MLNIISNINLMRPEAGVKARVVNTFCECFFSYILCINLIRFWEWKEQNTLYCQKPKGNFFLERLLFKQNASRICLHLFLTNSDTNF